MPRVESAFRHVRIGEHSQSSLALGRFDELLLVSLELETTVFAHDPEQARFTFEHVRIGKTAAHKDKRLCPDFSVVFGEHDRTFAAKETGRVRGEVAGITWMVRFFLLAGAFGINVIVD